MISAVERNKHFVAIAEAVDELRWIPSHTGVYKSGVLIVDETDVTFLVSLRDEMTDGRPNGKLRLRVGRKSFPQRADGTFSYWRVAELLVNYVRYQARKV